MRAWQGCNTYKLKFGNRGHNQPVKDMLTDKVCAAHLIHLT